MSIESSKKIAEYLLDVQAVKLQPEQSFTWASGWKSPIYCDNRTTLAYPEVRDFIKLAFALELRQTYPEADVVAGVATGAIAQAVLVADLLGLPMIYVRPQAKEHGMGNQIEGYFEKGQRVVVIEDLISTGGSSLKAVEALRAAGLEVMGMLSVFTYGFPQATEAFANANIELLSLTDYNELLEVAQERGLIADAQLNTLQQWREQPDKWGR